MDTTAEAGSGRAEGGTRTAEPPGGTHTIAQVAEEFGITLRTIRWYEDQGLISPERRGQQRLFRPRDRVRLALVLRGKRLGFSLEEIRTILDMYDAEPGETGQLRYLLEQIHRRRAELLQRQRDLQQTLAEFDELEQRCRDDLGRLESSG
ncbi:DNA-binding transcriptional MerR regulator [Kineococcus xinjiangensis]|uniref:DNA-binding transcriptional MerR regulator n=1 Tax=Kineococcus xinjiangensis TaxID=512762 RepID=A0A2S6IUN3_9ACTN|nr:MerR family DNA-binding transcriptional regulator [Kineococcus xinjiangensis]PPK97746.1 DNA-binding transcriptional MerR regulator [Kineococcus xinjiangensis]